MEESRTAHVRRKSCNARLQTRLVRAFKHVPRFVLHSLSQQFVARKIAVIVVHPHDLFDVGDILLATAICIHTFILCCWVDSQRRMGPESGNNYFHVRKTVDLLRLYCLV